MKAMWKKALTIILAVSMTGGALPATVSAETNAKLLADFNFDDEASGFTGGDARATGTYTLADSFDAENGKALYLDGSTQFLTVTNTDGGSLLSDEKELTISYDAKPDRTATSWVFYAAPDNRTQSSPEYYIGSFSNNGNTKVERYNNGRTLAIDVATGADWSHVDIVFDEDVTTVYVNGIKRQTVTNSNAQLEDILGTNSILQIGKANWGSGEFYKGWIDNFKIYDAALTDKDLVDSEAAASAVAADKAVLTLPEVVEDDFKLPSSGANASVITWSVADNANAVIGEDGYSVAVTRPSAKDGDVKVTFTATISMAGVQDTKEIEVTITKELADQDIVDDVYEKLDIVNRDDVRGNVELLTEMKADGTTKAAEITWESSDDSIVTDVEKDGKAPGIVTRPAADTDVTLTATIKSGDVSKTKTFTLKVKAAPEELAETTDYLFAYFTGTENTVTDEQIYFSTSQDGSQWTDLTANGSPVLFSEIGDKGVRDPYLIRSPEGDKFYLIATDLSIYYRGGWGNAAATTTGSTNLVVWESYNLVDWTEPRLVDVAGPIPEAGCAWAPEAFYDANTGNYVVYWATYSTQSNVNGDGMNMYYATTRDFYNFSEPKIWIDRGNSIIDTTMIQVGDKYYRASGDGQITIEASDSIYEGWEIIGTLKDIFNNNRYSGSYLEGPEFFKYNEDDYLTDENGNPVETWGLMCDQYREGKGYLPFRTTNIDDQTTESWSPASDVNFGSLKKRHGTILPITRVEYDLIMEKVGRVEPVEPDTPVDPSERKVLADFDFDNEETGLTSENAKATGDYTLTDSYSSTSGKALYLDGSSTNFLNVTNTAGSSLLTDARQLTISFEAKADRSETNWAFYAAPNADTQSYPNEHYIGVMIGGGTLTVERYNNNGSRPESPSTSVGDEWMRVDVVMDGNTTKIYVNGKMKSQVSSTYKIQDILGDSSILQIGKANWKNGEFYKGWIDNLTIVNYALDEETITANAEAFEKALNGEDVFKEADKSALEALVKECENMIDIGYTAESMAALAEACESAKAVLDKTDATQEEVDASYAALKAAEEDLELDSEKLPYEDVEEGIWYYDAVYYNYFAGTMTGKSDTTFAPEESLARGQFASILHRMEGAPKVEFRPEFPDVAADGWYAEPILWAKNTGVVSGYGNGNFGPGDPIVREQMAVMMYNYAKSKGYDISATDDLDAFADAAEVSPYALESVQWAVGAGIISGKAGGTVLDPLGKTTRAECAAIIMNFMNKYAE